ncbi:PIN domain-like protein [Pelagophyceae sp. CCMP2097]|nr:PIN domain-like protein [Pelagophyceae sp. CCMP2097]
MGVLGLLPQLRGYTHEVHISKYAGQVVAVDGYAWLHRGVHACAPELGCGGQSEKHIAWCLARVALLLHYGVKPLLVFDGAPLPAKAAQEMVRRERREAAKQQALQCVREGRHDEARKHFAKSIDVTPLMAAAFIDACVGRWQGRVDFVVAPYEADAQLAWLARSGECVAVISEDSDNLPYGVPRALFKLQADGTASEIELDRLFDAASARGDSLDFTGWSRSMFVLMCCFAGCDYVDAVRGVGIKGAYRLVQRHREAGRVLRALRYEFGAAVPADYEAALTRALLTYSHQRVFCRRTRSAVSLAPSAASDGVVLDLDSMDFLGRPLPDAVATGIAHCLLDPETFAPLERPRPSATLAACSLQRATCDLKQKNTLENYFAARPPSVDETRSARRVDEDDDDATAATAQSKSTTAARTPRCAAAVDASSKRRRAAPSARWSRTPASLFDARPPVTVLDEADSDASLCAAPSSRVASGRASKFFRAADTENAENTENADRDAEGCALPPSRA